MEEVAILSREVEAELIEKAPSEPRLHEDVRESHEKQ